MTYQHRLPLKREFAYSLCLAYCSLHVHCIYNILLSSFKSRSDQRTHNKKSEKGITTQLLRITQ